MGAHRGDALIARVAKIAIEVLGAAIVAFAVAFFYFFRAPAVAPPHLDGDLMKATIEVDSVVRRYRVYRPAKMALRPALLFVLHGSASDGSEARRATFYEFDRLSDRHGFIVVYPDGYEQHWNDCWAAERHSANTKDVDDMAFFSAMIDRFVAEEKVDPDRVYATGISGGGQLAYRFALEMPERFAAVAPVAASLPDDASLNCTRSGEPIAILIMNGTADPMNPYAGGRVGLYGLWGDPGTVLSTDATVEYFAQLAGHAAPPRVTAYYDAATHDDSRAEHVSFRGGSGPEVALIRVEGGGHTFPHPFYRFPRFMGATNADIDAAAEIWRFFWDKRREDR